ncbi:gamma-glutamylcyclotransferase family protein [Pseudooceanicola sp. 200-1SW]|uniref:gamma-glutamylcyclotransferase family protein n=1 Tax=Pseudooceanicola sp. 200-1SW TaxID=3425949 RepID=UPI003D7FEB2F
MEAETVTADPHFFGYGSLVNRATHVYGDARPARAQGWRRLWRHTGPHEVAILTAVPHAGTEIEGLIAPVPGADWAALDLREAAYDRLPATPHIAHDGAPVEIAIYSIPAAKHPPAPAPRAILLSYLDVVVQGYRTEFGEPGVARFFDTTDGWDTTPVLDDRAAPRYPRAQALSPEDRQLVDQHLARLRVARLSD